MAAEIAESDFIGGDDERFLSGLDENGKPIKYPFQIVHGHFISPMQQGDYRVPDAQAVHRINVDTGAGMLRAGSALTCLELYGDQRYFFQIPLAPEANAMPRAFQPV